MATSDTLPTRGYRSHLEETQLVQNHSSRMCSLLTKFWDANLITPAVTQKGN